MVDETLIPLYNKRQYYGDMWFDQKSNYSINVQVINTSNLKIINYVSGFQGSQHNFHCFQYTRLALERKNLLAPGEWIWADVGYKLQDWCMIFYKRPASLKKENKEFNYNLSRIQIKSEHAIGYLKQQFQLLKKLCLNIHSKDDIVYVTGWINACIILQCFCIDQELNLQRDFLTDGRNWERAQQEAYQLVIPAEDKSSVN